MVEPEATCTLNSHIEKVHVLNLVIEKIINLNDKIHTESHLNIC